MNVTSKVPAAYSGLSVLAYLAERFNYLSEAAWRQLIAEGRVTCNELGCDPATTVVTGNSISCDMPAFEAPAVNLDYHIVFQDNWLIGVNKPAGLRVHSGGKFATANLAYHLRHVRQPAFPEAALVNRLDADTSGLVLLARDKAVLRHLMQQFADGLVTKHYLAVVEGRPSPASGTIDLPIGPVADARVPRYTVDHNQGKASVTHYTTVRRLGDCHALLELQPETGRTHQLRVHLAAIGHPIAGDALYTMSDQAYLDWRLNPPAEAPLWRQALHSHRLQFFHPVTQTDCILTAPLPPDLTQFINSLGADRSLS
ncbi:MAG: hypothetical protein C0614_10265 [Desulfuromonas sp.]|nr:MAG: hypothetical protein C0614_10265 [Desulfuromonas sp.]